MLRHLSEQDFLSVFEGVPQTGISSTELEAGITALDIASVKTGLFASKGEARRMISQGGLSINKEKITDPATIINPSFLINGKYILLQKGKKGYFIVKID
jgi:tyrosyl-tRNA synthetase